MLRRLPEGVPARAGSDGLVRQARRGAMRGGRVLAALPGAAAVRRAAARHGLQLRGAAGEGIQGQIYL